MLDVARAFCAHPSLLQSLSAQPAAEAHCPRRPRMSRGYARGAITREKWTRQHTKVRSAVENPRRSIQPIPGLATGLKLPVVAGKCLEKSLQESEHQRATGRASANIVVCDADGIMERNRRKERSSRGPSVPRHGRFAHARDRPPAGRGPWERTAPTLQCGGGGT